MKFGSMVLILSTILYATAAVLYWREHSPYMGGMYLCYAGANIFLILIAEGM